MKTRVGKINLKIVMFLLCLFFVAAGLVLLQRWEQRRSTAAGGEAGSLKKQILFNGRWYSPKDELETILVMGVDKFEDETRTEGYLNTQQADFLLLLVIDREEETCTALQLNRDTMTDIQILGVTGQPAGTFEGQLALAHTYGSGGKDSCINTVDVVSNLLCGQRIDHYMSLTMDAVARLNDLVGGVEVTIEDDFSGVDETLIQGETMVLNGEQALHFVRSRQSVDDGTNLSRMERQRTYLTALYEAVKECSETDEDFYADTMMEIADYLVSDLTVHQMSQLGEIIEVYGVSEILTLKGEAVKGEEYMEFYVDESALQQTMMELFYELGKAE